jgi:hypothetical protein
MGVEDDIASWIQPSRNDVRRAKTAILAALDDETIRGTGHLIAAARKALGLPSLEPLPMKIDCTREPPNPDSTPVAAFRGSLAGQHALAELAARGVIIPGKVDDALNREDEVPAVTYFKLVHIGGTTNTDRLSTGAPETAFAYRMGSWPNLEDPWYLDPDLLSSDELAGVQLNERASRSLGEALDAYRQGLYLACASLLGVVSEAVWYEGAARVIESRGGWGALDKAVRSTATADVIQLVAQAIREQASGAKLRRTTADELVAEATVMRELRNYGVHPAQEDAHLERWFEEDTCGLLIARMYRYLRQLTRALDAVAGSFKPETNG